MSHSSSLGSGSLERPRDASPPEETANHPTEFPVTREQLNHYRDAAENAQSELAATLVKFECAQSELRELRSKMLSKEVCCQELKAEMESYKENSARKSSLLVSLRGRVQDLQEELAALSASKIRTEISAHTAMKENQELMKKVLELDEKLQPLASLLFLELTDAILPQALRNCSSRCRQDPSEDSVVMSDLAAHSEGPGHRVLPRVLCLQTLYSLFCLIVSLQSLYDNYMD